MTMDDVAVSGDVEVMTVTAGTDLVDCIVDVVVAAVTRWSDGSDVDYVNVVEVRVSTAGGTGMSLGRCQYHCG